MKKILVLALSAILVLGMAAMVMAAPVVTLNGEVDSAINTTKTTSNTDGQLTANAVINDNVSATAEFTYGPFDGALVDGTGTPLVTPNPSKNIGIMDNYSVTVKTDIGNFQAGYVDIGTGGKFDVLASQIYDVGKQLGGANLIYSNKITDNITAKLAYDYMAKDAALDLGYATDLWSVNLAYGAPNGGNASYGLNGAYNVSKQFVAYGQYAIKSAYNASTNPNQDAMFGIGGKYTGEKAWAEAEYGQRPGSQNETMVKVGYFVQPNANVFVENDTKDGGAAQSIVELAVTF